MRPARAAARRRSPGEGNKRAGRRRAPRHTPPARSGPHRPPMAPASPGRALTAAALRISQVQSSPLVFKNTGLLVFTNTGGHAMPCHAAYRAVTRHTVQHVPCAQGSASTSMRTAERACRAAAHTARPNARRARMHMDTSMSVNIGMKRAHAHARAHAHGHGHGHEHEHERARSRRAPSRQFGYQSPVRLSP